MEIREFETALRDKRPAAKVIPGIPRWFYTAVNLAFKAEIRAQLPRKSGNRINAASNAEVENFLLISQVVHPNCIYGFLDHVGHDKSGHLISEPYAATCAGCLKDAPAFAERIHARYCLTRLTYYAPELEECVRMTFSQWGKR
jgi:hypothetical protein